MLEQRAAEIAGKTAGMAEKAAYGTAIGTAGMGAAKTFCGLLLSDWSLIVAMLTTVIVSGVSVYCKLNHLKLARERKNSGPENDSGE